MAQKKSTKKKAPPITLTIRFRDDSKLQAIRDAATIEDLSLNKFIVRSVVAAATKVVAAHTPTSK